MDWPKFPDPYINGDSIVKYDPETKRVDMPIEYWLDIVSAWLDVEKNIEILK